ncbi:MAG: hypothetical protein GWN79_27160, partial [Actinobacteria bacterium]|nr:hypothetical protein [Actinomycetota bacterium]NIS36701.1 hypothetical protein [Actinomycetota bacterium]NIT98864.1 hypothetical protein [Actinomycetota bacterium]NIU22491.1 hypothetical protein [Actinomycetota bacterium]NIU71182.1 hypothetical protein [Actinomycetota bacterium]
RDPEFGDWGLVTPFDEDAVIELDHRLGIVDEVTPSEGYAPGPAGRTSIDA